MTTRQPQSRRRVDTETPAEEVTSHPRAVPFPTIFLHPRVHGPFPVDKQRTCHFRDAYLFNVTTTLYHCQGWK